MFKQTIKYVLILLLAISTGACERVSNNQSKGKNMQLHALFDEYRDANFELNPIGAMFEGDYRFNDRFGDGLSGQYLRDSLALEQEFLDKLQAVDHRQLNSQDQLSYDIFEYDRVMAVKYYRDGYARLDTLMPVTQFFSTPSFVALLGTGTSAQPFNTVEDYDNWLKRLGGFIPWVDQAIANMRIGMSEGVVLPALVVERVLPLLQAHMVGDVQDSVFYQPLNNFPDSIPERNRERLVAAYASMIAGEVVPAYKRLHDFMADEYLPHARETHGIGALPGGKEWYAHQVKFHTTTDLTPEQIHKIGKNSAAELFKEMESTKNTIGFEGDMKAFFQFLREDPQFYFDESEQLVQSYRDVRTDIEQRLPRLVVDTGLHAFGWTRERAIAWMESNCPITHTNAVAEVERYMVMPGQALAYKIGQLNIRDLRRRAEDKLGDRFDIKAFHRQVLADGSMPLTLLERKIVNWLSSRDSK